jgi:hypothetical protein
MAISPSGMFSSGSTYVVTVLTQPTGQTCSVSTGVGTVSGNNVSNVAVTCSAYAYTVGGTVSGLSGTVVLQNNSGDNLSISKWRFNLAPSVMAVPVTLSSPNPRANLHRERRGWYGIRRQRHKHCTGVCYQHIRSSR